MIGNAFILSIVTLVSFTYQAFASNPAVDLKTVQAVSPSPDAKIEWPDYKSKPWTLIKQEPLAVEVLVPVENNRYVLGSGRYDVLVGTITNFMDSPDIQKSTMAVLEGDILGKGVILRVMQMRGVGVLSMQLKVDGKWQDVPRDSHITLDVIDPKSVVFKGELRGIVLKMMEGEVEKLKIVIENKLLNKQKK